MKRINISICVLLITLTACTKDPIVGSGIPISEFRNVADFTKVSSEGVFEVTITQGNSQSVEVIADDNIIRRVKTEVVNNELRLYLDDNNYEDISLKANIVAKRINGIKNTGVGNIEISNVDEGGSFEVFNSGTGNIAIQGNAESLMLQNEGTGKFNGFLFTVSNCNVEIIGSGDCEVHAISTLNVDIEGSGDVYYKGTPALEVNISGSGKVIDAN
ncbi:head GIN domain-containing protein [Robiginitalea aurantiaca]|uniref:Head GIN domain-containing protein n=1 Tax=Robiginitalea aurantiaca TaxID=3056915 RepID=A0ABT7WIE3_9FLAO|nr:head GIN domain-containing protein [Robiginitalea aurantiaca]MDM9632685.1 head GIN domain-containing protein [Robiginitalea aurantiaca]